MSGLFYYDYLSRLSKGELFEMDALVKRNRKIFLIYFIISGSLLLKPSVNANDEFLPIASGFTSKAPIVRPVRGHSPRTKTATGTPGSPKPSSGSGSSSNNDCPTINKKRTAPKFSDRNYVPKRKEKQCSASIL